MSLSHRFSESVEFISQNKKKQALEHLNAIRADGNTSAEIEYNRAKLLLEDGSVAEALDGFGNAVYYAREWSEFKSDLILAQSKVEMGLGTEISHPSEWALKLKSVLRPTELLFAGFLFFLAFIFFKFVRSGGNKFNRFNLGLAALSVVFFSAWIFSFWGNSMVITSSKLSLKSLPLESSENLQELPEGTRARIKRVSGEFTELERPGAFRGWVKSADIRTIRR